MCVFSYMLNSVKATISFGKKMQQRKSKCSSLCLFCVYVCVCVCPKTDSAGKFLIFNRIMKFRW